MQYREGTFPLSAVRRRHPRVPESSTSRRPTGSVAKSPESALLPHQPCFFSVPIALLGVLALVVQLLALGHAKLQLGLAARVEIKLARDDPQALALAELRELG